MKHFTPFETLFDVTQGAAVSFPPPLDSLVGSFTLPASNHSPALIANFVTTLDGVVSLNAPGHMGGGDISGFNAQDRLLMGVLRSLADAVILGAGTLRAENLTGLAAEESCPEYADSFAQLRERLQKPRYPLNVFITAHGDIDPTAPVLHEGKIPVLFLTTQEGEQRLRKHSFPHTVSIAALKERGPLDPHEMISAVRLHQPGTLFLIEGGAHLLNDFLVARCLDELFLTLAPQIAGREDGDGRPGLVSGHHFAPDAPLWGTLVSLKRSESHLFLRYAFSR
ncbi:riboflavin biosynthesis pyrimidine reductase [Thermosporothrix hazakensis]|jgi:riboflavin biosynthesis pyrimidine reductase|uniref:Riboflavin biosynthesis pyrimidine reductase n=2 Tax=Thermosporothrix TaxID=768650 RepID=A0A326UK71_THEHA|nr:dihydrofolate reductase family protein [Thermosporothrix hazakensis]PZW32823.1 riboflavin biosynthesis pyrimidine reductase [Thermosporothrix hazakensis]BBH90804.1 hypothetical protein KTC_55550 [Thermosporothrix sp. COM3]GCE48854.1 hypothetical protein KTH_37230 [Thermosporothrix hazakensis]